VKRGWLIVGLGLAGSAALLVGVVCVSSGCSSLGYYAQSVGGHLALMSRAKPVQQWLADDATPAALRERLELSQRMRDFAVRQLLLPDNRSYRAYADLGRTAAVWNVVAAPELSLQLKTWCFPVLGCVGYRGYYDRADADALAQSLRAEGLEVAVYGVPAYSTLGWMNWLGGDPLLNTFVNGPEGELARLIFHELAHQVVYAKDDTAFNESFATAVERIGAARWLGTFGSPEARLQYQQLEIRREQFRELTLRTRSQLDALFKSAAGDAEKRERKAALMAQQRAGYERLKREQWDGYAGYDAWFERANNASLAVQGAYNDWVPAFERLFEREGEDFARFYAEVSRLAALPKGQRQETLRALH
jgi:predicted aminopeptidase